MNGKVLAIGESHVVTAANGIKGVIKKVVDPRAGECLQLTSPGHIGSMTLSVRDGEISVLKTLKESLNRGFYGKHNEVPLPKDAGNEFVTNA